jgi:hypothetical protein
VLLYGEVMCCLFGCNEYSVFCCSELAFASCCFLQFFGRSEVITDKVVYLQNSAVSLYIVGDFWDAALASSVLKG